MSELFQGWGRPVPDDMRDKIAATWGARAIYTNQVIDLLPDRQSWWLGGMQDYSQPFTDEQRKRMKPLSDWINKKGLLFLRKEAKRLRTDESRVVSLDDGLFHVEASPQASYGYLYIRAWMLK